MPTLLPNPPIPAQAVAPLVAQVSQEDLRERFLRARTRMNDTSEPQRAPQPTPRPAPAPKPTATPRPRTAPPPSTPQDQRRAQPERNRPKEKERRRETAPIVIQKEGETDATDETSELRQTKQDKPGFWQRVFGSRRSREPGYRFLTAAIRRDIDRARIRKGRWKYIVVHNSGSRSGNAKIFDYYHRKVRKMRNGMAYHFVIGNGSKSGNGAIEIGDRWHRQINGGHVASDYLNDIAIGICLVGDFNRDLPTENQLAALKELIDYLRRIAGNAKRKEPTVRGHRDINPRPTDCPGDRWMRTGWLKKEFY